MRGKVAQRGAITVIITAAVAVALLCASAAALAQTWPRAAREATATADSVLTLRTDGDHDALWLLPPDGGAATAAGMLPGHAQNVCASPDGSTVAYIPLTGKPFVWIGYGPAAPKTISLEAAGIKTLTGMTWIALDQLLVAGSKKANDFYGYNDRLYTVNVTTGAVAAFRGLSGTEPDASFDTGKVVYVKFKKLDNGSAKNDNTPKYKESLMLTSVSGSGAGRELDAQSYRPVADYRAFAAPQIAAGGEWIISGQTGSDVSVTYTVSYLGNDYSETWLTMSQPTPLAFAWSPDSPMLAFGADVTGPDDTLGCVYVADVAGGSLERTAVDLLSRASVGWVMDLAWSAGTRFVADALGSSANIGDPTELHVLVMDAADLSKLTDLGEGHLSVWVK
jgi:hypothetical protein